VRTFNERRMKYKKTKIYKEIHALMKPEDARERRLWRKLMNAIYATGIFEFMFKEHRLSHADVPADPYYKIDIISNEKIAVTYGVKHSKETLLNNEYTYYIHMDSWHPTHIELKYTQDEDTCYGNLCIPLLNGKPHGLKVDHKFITNGVCFEHYMCYLSFYRNGELEWQIITDTDNGEEGWCEFSLRKDSADIGVCKSCEHCIEVNDHSELENTTMVKCKRLCWFYPNEHDHLVPLHSLKPCPKAAAHVFNPNFKIQDYV